MTARRRVWRGLHGSAKHFSKATHTCRKSALRRVWLFARLPPHALSKVALSRTFEFLVPWPSLAVQGGLSGLTDVLDGRAAGGSKSQRGIDAACSKWPRLATHNLLDAAKHRKNILR